jgi:4-amino-4-deoxy-L-arabinose transferase-like glycosyltransferase
MNKETPFYLFFLGVFLIIISPSLLTQGMFMDGSIYATVANNMAHGVGSFWKPYFTSTCNPEFYGHPPLAMGIQSVFFKIFGDAFWVEKLYSFSTWLLVCIGLVKIWRHFQLSSAWLPVLMLLTVSRIIWASTNNGLENTLAVFVVFSVYFYLKASSGRFLYWVFSGLFIAFGFLTKGPFGLFLWGMPFVYELMINRKKIVFALFASLKLVFFSLFPLCIIYFSSEAAYYNLIQYIDLQLVGSFGNDQTVSTRFFIVKYFLSEMILPVILLLVVLFFGKKEIARPDIFKERIRVASAFFIIGLFGVLPIMVSMKQSGFYILPTFPIFSLSFAILIERPLNVWIEKFTKQKRNFKTFFAISTITLLLGIVLNVRAFGTFGRDEDKIADMHTINRYLNGQKKVGVSYKVWNDWGFQAYFQRYHHVALDAVNLGEHHFFLLEAGENPETFPIEIKRITPMTIRYHLYSRVYE